MENDDKDYLYNKFKSVNSEGSKIEATKYNSNIIEHFDVKNIVFLKDEIFQDSESDTNSEELQSDNADEFENNKYVGNKEIEQSIFEFDSTNLAIDLMQE
ncbi:9738_t:CDS:2 [Gigaspora margarita]|uniref:9738_t:CDS:1 n=1 Tax=Gigaspora margarita TaxID=4874 RepID=A0ABN7VEK4_GIGMA|nr:9738_t:CDS:2 [Gigaspora margarita]